MKEKQEKETTKRAQNRASAKRKPTGNNRATAAKKRSSRARAGAEADFEMGRCDTTADQNAENKTPPVPDGQDERYWAHPEMFRRADLFIDLLFEGYQHFEALHAADLVWGVVNRQIQGRPGFAERYDDACVSIGFRRKIKKMEELQEMALEGYMKPIYYKGRITSYAHSYSDQALMKFTRLIEPERQSSSYATYHQKPSAIKVVYKAPSPSAKGTPPV